MSESDFERVFEKRLALGGARWSEDDPNRVEWEAEGTAEKLRTWLQKGVIEAMGFDLTPEGLSEYLGQREWTCMTTLPGLAPFTGKDKHEVWLKEMEDRNPYCVIIIFDREHPYFDHYLNEAVEILANAEKWWVWLRASITIPEELREACQRKGSAADAAG